MTFSRKDYILLGLLFLLISCYEEKEGCLDVLAKNFDLEADINCCENPDDCCCEYPVLTISIKQQYDSVNLSSGATYLNLNAQPFKIDKIQFFISNVRLSDGVKYAVDDTISVSSVDGQTVQRPDDVTLVESGLFSAKIGSFTRPGSYSLLEFTVGLTEPERSADREQFESGHPLRQSVLRDTVKNEWLLFDVAWIPDTLTGTIEHLTLPGETTFQISLPIEIDKDPGENLTVPIVIDYARWFADIDIIFDDQETKKQKILNGFSESITIL